MGGGGLAAGVAAYVKAMSPKTKIIGVQPEGAPSLITAKKAGKPTPIDGRYSRFCDGSAVDTIGELCFHSCNVNLDAVVTVAEGRLATTILDLYN